MTKENFKERVRLEIIKAAKQYKKIYVDYEYLVCSEAFVENWIYQCAESACPVFWKSPVRKEEIMVSDR